jgi:hypothetical protein
MALSGQGPRPAGGAPLVPTAILAFLILSVQLIPSVPMYLTAVESMALGTMIASGLCIAVVGFYWIMAARRHGKGILHAGAGGSLLIGGVITVIVLHAVVADEIQSVDFGRLLAALIPLILLLGAAVALSAAIRSAAESQISFAVRVSFWVLMAIVALKLTGLEPRSRELAKPTFPFTETSHFALALGPIYVYRCAVARGARRDLWLGFGFAMALVLQSSSLLCVAFAAAVICRRFIVVTVLAAVVAVALSAQLKYFISRADISSNSSNISTLVYVEGWEMLADSLTRTNGWGLGFEQLGLKGTGVTAAETIRDLTGGTDLNLKDGGFVMAKVGSEFGALGLLLVAGYCVLAARSVQALKARRGSLNLTLARSVVIAYSVDIFVRGVGYFAHSTLLFIGALLVLAPAGGLLRIGSDARLQRLVAFR